MTLDPLGETLHRLRLDGLGYSLATLGAPWSLSADAADGMALHLIAAGECVLEIEGREPIGLTAGSLVLLPRGVAHRLRDGDPDTSAHAPLEGVEVGRMRQLTGGGDGRETQVFTACLRVAPGPAQRLVAMLPEVIDVVPGDDTAESWLLSTARMMRREAAANRPGGEVIMTRLADVLAVQVIRAWLEGDDADTVGWIAALRDPHLGAALAAFHTDPARPWTVEDLAAEARMSRSAFAEHFGAVVGDSPMRYATRWRLESAREALSRDDAAIARIAARHGYASEASFARAFRREFDMTPTEARETESAR